MLPLTSDAFLTTREVLISVDCGELEKSSIHMSELGSTGRNNGIHNTSSNLSPGHSRTGRQNAEVWAPSTSTRLDAFHS